MQNLEIWGLVGTRVKFVVESAIFGIADFDLPIHYATFMGLNMMIKGSLLLSAAPPLLSVSVKKVPFWAKI